MCIIRILYNLDDGAKIIKKKKFEKIKIKNASLDDDGYNKF